MEMNSTEPNYCFNISQNVTSLGIFIGKKFSVSEFLTYSMPLLELQLGIILMTAHGLSCILGRFGISMFICQILVGRLNPWPNILLGKLNFMKDVVFPSESCVVLNHVAVLGILLHLFLIAVEINIESVKRLTGKLSIIAGIASGLLPTLVGLAILRPFKDYLDKRTLYVESKVLIYVQCFTAFSVVVQLKELRIRNSDIGHLLLSLALISCGISIQDSLINTFVYGADNGLIVASAYIGLVIVLAFLITPGMNWVVRRTPVGSPVDSSITCSLMLIGLMSEGYCQVFRMSPGIGVYTFGVLVPAGPPLGSAFVETFETFNDAVLMPVAIVVATLNADMSTLYTHFGEIRIYMLFIVVIGVVKILSFLVPMLFWGIPLTDSVLFATILNNKGTIEMAVYLYAFQMENLNVPGYSLLILNTLLTSLAVTIIVKRLYDPAKNYVGYHNRNVTSLKQNSQLRILVCIHDQDNIYSITGFLDVFHPTKERFLVLGVLHLVPLTGLNTPMIISHDKKNHPVTFFDSSSDSQVIISFDQYEQKNPTGISVSTYTAISTVPSMNEDILTLAFDHVASIVILPFHRKWSIHGRIESEDAKIRAINRKVLEKAPCSVAIFFDRGKLGRQTKLSRSIGSPLSICMIFLGGKDDWEALALAKRTVEDTSSRLTIIHFMLNNEATKDVEATHHDDEKDEYTDEDAKELILEIMLNTYEQNQTSLHNVQYVTKFVNDGAETGMEICSIADKYDLFVVGRRYGIDSPKTSGLSEWTDIPELGIIGDILACKDINTRAAVLVVQQQRKF